MSWDHIQNGATTLSQTTLSMTTLCIKWHNAGCRFTESDVSFIVMLSVIMLSVIMLNVIMLSVIMLNVIMLNVVVLSVMGPSRPNKQEGLMKLG